MTYREILARLTLPNDMVPFSEAAQDWILDQLLRELPIELDQQKLSSEIARLEAMDSHNLQYEILETGNFSLLLPENRQKRKQAIRQQAQREMQIDKLLHEIAQEEQITVTAQERLADAQRIAEENQIPLEEVRSFMGQSFELLQEDLLIRKTLHWLCSSVSVTH